MWLRHWEISSVRQIPADTMGAAWVVRIIDFGEIDVGDAGCSDDEVGSDRG